MSAATLANTLICPPATGLDLDVIAVFWWLAMELIVEFNEAHCVAVTVAPTAKVVNAVWPYAEFHVALTLPPDVVDTNPL